jgi:hypothetical protein
MSLRKLIVITSVAAAVPLLAMATASGRGNDFSLSAAPQSQFVAPGGTATVNWLAWNNTDATASCDVTIQELSFTAWSGTIPPAASVGEQEGIPAGDDRNSRFTFVLTCDGSEVAKRAVNVKVR